jgi:drug/metabolite transporter (DMT)-like permease
MAPHGDEQRTRAILQALLVTFLWATSWVLIKIGLEEIPALPFAGLRYVLAFLVLLPFVWRPAQALTARAMPRRTWLQLAILGLLLYAVTQGSQFLGLALLPAITVNLLLSFSSILVVLGGLITLGERPTSGQWAGTGVYLLGVLLYFYPFVLPAGAAAGYLVVLVGVLANSISALLGRHLNRRLTIRPRVVTVVSMGVGSIVLLAAGILVQGWPSLTATGWAIVLWLAVVNSAFAFTLWNQTLRTLTAMESSLINSTMMVQIPILAWIFLGERPGGREIAGMALAVVGVMLVQLRLGRNRPAQAFQEGVPRREGAEAD